MNKEMMLFIKYNDITKKRPNYYLSRDKETVLKNWQFLKKELYHKLLKEETNCGGR